MNYSTDSLYGSVFTPPIVGFFRKSFVCVVSMVGILNELFSFCSRIEAVDGAGVLVRIDSGFENLNPQNFGEGMLVIGLF